MTAIDLKRPQMTSRESSAIKPKKTKLKAGGKIENIDETLDELLHNNKHLMELALQIISNERTVRSNIVEGLKEFNSQSLTTPARKGEQLVFMMLAIKKAFDLISDDTVERATENETLKKIEK